MKIACSSMRGSSNSISYPLAGPYHDLYHRKKAAVLCNWEMTFLSLTIPCPHSSSLAVRCINGRGIWVSLKPLPWKLTLLLFGETKKSLFCQEDTQNRNVRPQAGTQLVQGGVWAISAWVLRIPVTVEKIKNIYIYRNVWPVYFYCSMTVSQNKNLFESQNPNQ